MMRAMSGVISGGTHSVQGLHSIESLPLDLPRANFIHSLVIAVTGFSNKITVL